MGILLFHFLQGVSSAISFNSEQLHIVLHVFFLIIKILISITIVFAYVLCTGMLANCLFEAIGSLFFDKLVAEFAEEHYEVTCHKATLKENFALTSIALRYALVTAGLSIVGFIFGMFIPAGFLLAPLLTGKRIGVSYLWSSFLVDNTIAKRNNLIPKATRQLYSLGFISSFILSVPIFGLFVVPGMVLGGTMIYYERMRSK